MAKECDDAVEHVVHVILKYTNKGGIGMEYLLDPIVTRGQVKPIIRSQNTLIFPDGTSRKMTLRERWLWRRGKFVVLRLSDGKQTKLL